VQLIEIEGIRTTIAAPKLSSEVLSVVRARQ